MQTLDRIKATVIDQQNGAKEIKENYIPRYIDINRNEVEMKDNNANFEVFLGETRLTFSPDVKKLNLSSLMIEKGKVQLKI